MRHTTVFILTICLWGWSQSAFAALNLFAGVYMGTSQHSGGSIPCESGEFAIIVKADGNANALMLDIIDGTALVIEDVIVNNDGSFSANDIDVFGTDIIGTFTSTGVSGTFSDAFGCFGTLTGTKKPSTGPLAEAGGYYTGTASGNYSGEGLAGTTSGPVTMIIAADGSGFVVAVLTVFGDLVGIVVDGGNLNVSPTGSVSGTLLGGNIISGSLNMTAFTGGGTFSGSFFVPGIGTFTHTGTWSVTRQFPLPEPFELPDNDVVTNIPGTGVSVLLNDNTSSVVLHTDTAEAIAVADVDNNGEDDVIASFLAGTGPNSGAGGTYISRNQGALTQLTPLIAEAIAAGNFDGIAGDDLLLDFGVVGLASYLNDTALSPLTPESPLTMAVGDVDNSGQDDVVLSFTAFGTVLFLNFSVVSILDASAADVVAVGDIDGNGEDDIVASFAPGNGPGGTGGLFIARNQGVLSSLTTLQVTQVLAGDFDGSGRDDLVLDFGGATGLWLYLNDASAQFLTPMFPVAMAAGDMDSNGQTDMILSFTGIGTLAFKNLTTVEFLDPVGVALDLATGNIDGN